MRQLEQMDVRRKADEIGMNLKQLILQAVHRQEIVLGSKRGRASTCTTPGSTSKPPVKRNPALLASPSLPHVRRSLFNDQSAAEVSRHACMAGYTATLILWLCMQENVSELFTEDVSGQEEDLSNDV